MTVGQWVRRSEPGRKWHLVESVVADDAVTRCGRRLTDRADLPALEMGDAKPDVGVCKQCE